MDKQTLIRYLEDVVELEKQVFLQQQTLDALDSKIRSLGIKRDIYRPEKKELPANAMDNSRDYTYRNDPSYVRKNKIRAILIFVIAGIITLASCVSIWEPGGQWSNPLGGFGTFLIVGFITAMIGIGIDSLMSKRLDKEYSDRYYRSRVAENKADYNRRLAEQNADYDRRMAEYRRNVSDDAQRVDRELAEKRILEQERSALYQKHLQTKQVLQSYYDLDIIYGKYRNFVAVSSFVDYFKSGRCSTLGENTGGDGAYNTFETEVRLDRIIDRLDVVLSMLSQIKSNQWCIYNAIQEGNSISRRLVDATESLAESNAQIALSSAQTAQYSAQAAQYSAQTAQYAGITAANSAIAAYNAQQAANEAEHLRKLKQYELGIRGRRY